MSITTVVITIDCCTSWHTSGRRGMNGGLNRELSADVLIGGCGYLIVIKELK